MKPIDDDPDSWLALGFLVLGKSEPLELAQEAQEGLQLMLRLASLRGELRPSVERLLEIAYVIEGRLDSPTAAAALRNSILESADAMAAIEADVSAPTRAELKSLGKRLMRSKLPRKR